MGFYSIKGKGSATPPVHKKQPYEDTVVPNNKERAIESARKREEGSKLSQKFMNIEVNI